MAKALLGGLALLILLLLSGCVQNAQSPPQTTNTGQTKSIDCAKAVQNLECYNKIADEFKKNGTNLGNMEFEIIGERCGFSGLTKEDVEICSFFYPAYCNKIQPNDLEVRKKVTEAARQHAGMFSLDQVIDSYNWVKDNISYLNVPLDKAEPYAPATTLYVGSGDCKNQAVLIASMIEAMGGKSRILIVPDCQHAYAQYYVGDESVDTQKLADSIGERYPFLQGFVHTQKDNKETWLTLDPAGANYAGGLHPDCLKATKQYVITKCN